MLGRVNVCIFKGQLCFNAAQSNSKVTGKGLQIIIILLIYNYKIGGNDDINNNSKKTNKEQTLLI